MPMYDYDCEHCGASFEALNKISERQSSQCPECGEVAVQRVSAPMVSLDGTDKSFPGAWYKWEKKRNQKIAQERKQLDN